MFKEIGDVLDFHNLCVGARLFRIAARDDRLQFAGSDGIGGCEQGHVQPTRDERRSEEHTSELQSLMRISYAVFCLKKKKKIRLATDIHTTTYIRINKQLITRINTHN